MSKQDKQQNKQLNKQLNKFLISFVCFLSFSLSPLAQATQTQTKNQDCTNFKNEIPAFFMQGKIEVPENWDQPNGKKINIFYYGQTHINRKSETPVVFFNGGPSQNSHIPFGQFQTNAKSSQVPIIYIDQRGTGCSSPYPNTRDKDFLDRIQHYGSRSIVKDAEALRKHLLGSPKKWKIFGQSYGGFIAHRYLEIAPDSIAAIYAHGNSIMPDWRLFYKHRLLSQKRIIENYFAKFTQDQELIINIKKQIPDAQCFDNTFVKICGASVIDATVLLLGFPSSWDNLHLSLKSLVNADSLIIQNRLKNFVQNFIFNTFSNNPVPLALIAKLELNTGDDSDQCTEAIKQLKADGENPDAWLLNECRLSQSIQYLKTDTDSTLIENFKIKDPINLKIIEQNLTNNKNIMFYLYSGELDAYVPKETFNSEVNQLNHLKNFQYKNFENSGHDGYLTEPTLWDKIIQPLKKSKNSLILKHVNALADSADQSGNPLVIKGYMEGYNYPGLTDKISKTWLYIKKQVGIASTVTAPIIYFSPFVFAKEDTEWLNKQKSWVGSHPEIWTDWNAISNGKPPVEEGNPFPDWFSAFQYYDTNLIQVNPFANFFPYYKYDAYGNANDVAGLGYYSVGHEFYHYALNLKNIPVKLHHCIFILSSENKENIMSQLAGFLVNDQISSTLVFLRGSKIEEQLKPCEQLSTEEQKAAQDYLDDLSIVAKD